MNDFDTKEKKEIPFFNGIMSSGIRYPPNSTPPKGINHITNIKKSFSSKGASMLPKLQDFNHMFRQQANSLIDMNSSILPPGHPLFSRENSLTILKEENEKLLKENLELRKQLDTKIDKK